MSFDPMAAAVDWLDAYRAADIEFLLALHADDAVIFCGCGGMKTIAGKRAIQSYWSSRFNSHPSLLLEDIQPSPDGASLSYATNYGLVSASLMFNPQGRIATIICGPVLPACTASAAIAQRC